MTRIQAGLTVEWKKPCRSGLFPFDKRMDAGASVIKEMEIMRFLGLVRSSEGQGTPPPAMTEAMGAFIEASLRNGSLVQTGGLAPESSAARIRQSGGRLSFTDGPFAETKEVIGGYAILEAPSRAAAIEIMRRFMHLHEQHWPEWQGECELREMVFVTP